MINFKGMSTDYYILVEGIFESWEEIYEEAEKRNFLDYDALELSIVDNSGDNVTRYELEERYNVTSDGLDIDLFYQDFEDYEPIEKDYKTAILNHSHFYYCDYNEDYPDIEQLKEIDGIEYFENDEEFYSYIVMLEDSESDNVFNLIDDLKEFNYPIIIREDKNMKYLDILEIDFNTTKSVFIDFCKDDNDKFRILL